MGEKEDSERKVAPLFSVEELARAEREGRQREDRLRRRRRVEAREREEKLAREELESREREDQLRRRRRAEARKRDEKLGTLRDLFRNDFFRAYRYQEDSCQALVSSELFASEVSSFVQQWCRENLPKPELGQTIIPDAEQARAIGADRRDCLLVARAGAGKTATVVNRAFFLNRHCGVPETRMLLLAFNSKAAAEIRERLEGLSGTPWPHVMTFHALAWALVQHKGDILYDEKRESGRLSQTVQRIVDEALLDPRKHDFIRDLMIASFKSDWENIAAGGYDKSGPEMLALRRELPRETLGGQYVKSHGEKLIANFMFEHDIEYRYEYSHRWDKRNYRPDFTLPRGNGGIIVEYFGMTGDAAYDKQTEEKRRYWRDRSKSWTLVEVFPKNVASFDFEVWMTKRLQRHGCQCTRLTDEQIWEKARARCIDRFSRTIKGFILRARQLALSADEMQSRIDAHKDRELPSSV